MADRWGRELRRPEEFAGGGKHQRDASPGGNAAASEFGGAALGGGVEIAESQRETLAAVFGDEEMRAIGVMRCAMAQDVEKSFGGGDALLGGLAVELVRGGGDAEGG